MREKLLHIKGQWNQATQRWIEKPLQGFLEKKEKTGDISNTVILLSKALCPQNVFSTLKTLSQFTQRELDVSQCQSDKTEDLVNSFELTVSFKLYQSGPSVIFGPTLHLEHLYIPWYMLLYFLFLIIVTWQWAVPHCCNRAFNQVKKKGATLLLFWHWLSVTFTIDFKIWFRTLKAWLGLAPSYILHLLTVHEPLCSLRASGGALFIRLAQSVLSFKSFVKRHFSFLFLFFVLTAGSCIYGPFTTHFFCKSI